MPLDAVPVLNGNVVLDNGIAVVLSSLDLSNLPADVDRYRSHFASCPKSNRHRKPRGRLADFGAAS